MNNGYLLNIRTRFLTFAENCSGFTKNQSLFVNRK
ncbi:hypothetical protein SAMN05518863_1187 [Candidatus Pantoea symbiotica]|uniref:Uncharacterized protein n=1 Tax=Candidatus Pantoea symbiotica TaxID=1884370 RepID=A0A1I4EHG5_9GAMM|nr:hypothetical protein SAMN05518863_1187 [Pantoea symbiotica]SFV08221.1 hypothetical protein SAMN05518864_1187 [Pantoea sp. YR525]